MWRGAPAGGRGNRAATPAAAAAAAKRPPEGCCVAYFCGDLGSSSYSGASAPCRYSCRHTRRHDWQEQDKFSTRKNHDFTVIILVFWGRGRIRCFLSAHRSSFFPLAVSGSDSDDDPSKVVKHHAFDPFSGWGHMGTISKGYKIEHEAITPIKPIECDDPDACTSSPTVDAPPAPPPPWSTRSTVPSPPPPPPAPPPSSPAPPAKSTSQATSRRGRSGSSKTDDGPQPPPLPAFLGGGSPPPPPPAAAAPSNKGVVGVKSASDAKISAMERLRARKLVFDIKRLIGDADGMKDKAGVHKQASGGNGVLNDTADTIEVGHNRSRQIRMMHTHLSRC
jgi:hypothetical protein